MRLSQGIREKYFIYTAAECRVSAFKPCADCCSKRWCKISAHTSLMALRTCTPKSRHSHSPKRCVYCSHSSIDYWKSKQIPKYISAELDGALELKAGNKVVSFFLTAVKERSYDSLTALHYSEMESGVSLKTLRHWFKFENFKGHGSMSNIDERAFWGVLTYPLSCRGFDSKDTINRK